MKSQKKLIHQEDWDYLIILDACRHDIFKEVYEDFLTGDLEKVKSEGTYTTEWLNNTFDGEYNWTYISANPFVNSKGVDCSGFKATKHFPKIYDLWETHWSERGTVLPWRFKEAVEEIDPEPNAILHLIQPHRPLISMDKTSMDWSNLKDGVIKGERTFSQKLRKELSKLAVRVLGELRASLVAEFLRGHRLRNAYDEFVCEHGAQKIIEEYKKTLAITLEDVSDIARYLGGNIIVTTDHGEAFGEDGLWGHHIKKNTPALIHIPWLEVDL